MIRMSKTARKMRFRPQNGQRLRELRDKYHLRQSEFADRINEYLKRKFPDIHASEMLTQSMISDLELGNTDLSVLHLLAISAFCDVPSAELLIDDLQPLGRSELTIGNNQDIDLPNCQIANQASDSMMLPYFCSRQKSKQFIVYSGFPSGMFTVENCFHCRWQNKDVLREHIEFYSLDSLISFLFSPVNQYNKQEKIAILERMLSYFGTGIYQRIYFMPVHLGSKLRDPSLHIAPDDGQVTFLFSDKDVGVSFVEINNQELSTRLYKYYHQETLLVSYSIMLLEIAHQTLTMNHEASLGADIVFFYQQCALRTSYADWVKACFSPEIQQDLVMASIG